MLASQIPSKFSIPWGNAADVAHIRPIPVASQQAIQGGAASLTDGFPPATFIQVAGGGVPPFGQDMNGILNQITRWEQWAAVGGPITYDAAFVSAIGGYPRGAMLLSNSGHAVYECLADNNSLDPNTLGAANWRVASCVWSAQEWVAAGSANAQTITLSPAPVSSAQMTGIPIWVVSQGTNTGAATLSPNGLGALPIVNPGGGGLVSGQLLSGYRFQVLPTGTAYQMVSASPAVLSGEAAFATPGTFTWVCPTGVTQVNARVWGGGGGGGGVAGIAQSSGGSAGGYSKKLCAVVPGTSYTVVVGAGGGGGAGTPANGSTGGASSFGGFISASGGGPGFASSSGGQATTSDGGVGTGGSLNLPGTTGSGGNPNTNGGSGGSSPLGIGGAAAGSVNGAGTAGQQPGGGGGGTACTTGGQAGGVGGDGLVTLDW